VPRAARPRPRRPGSRDRGSAAAELVLVTPLLIVLLLLAVAAGRLVTGRLDVDSAAQQAARAASQAGTPGQASAQAAQAAQAALAGQPVTCDPALVTTDTSQFAPGGEVTVQVTCTVRLSDLSLLHVPGSETVTATATAPVDTYRTVSLGFRDPGAGPGPAAGPA
jgi:Flp pilus assembly protein TadG